MVRLRRRRKTTVTGCSRRSTVWPRPSPRPRSTLLWPRARTSPCGAAMTIWGWADTQRCWGQPGGWSDAVTDLREWNQNFSEGSSGASLGVGPGAWGWREGWEWHGIGDRGSRGWGVGNVGGMELGQGGPGTSLCGAVKTTWGWECTQRCWGMPSAWRYMYTYAVTDWGKVWDFSRGIQNNFWGLSYYIFQLINVLIGYREFSLNHVNRPWIWATGYSRETFDSLGVEAGRDCTSISFFFNSDFITFSKQLKL